MDYKGIGYILQSLNEAGSWRLNAIKHPESFVRRVQL